jgi:hypothetical protein
MTAAVAKADLLQGLHGPVSGLGMMGELQGQGRVFERGHGRDEVKGLKDDAQMLAPEAGQSVLAHGRQVHPAIAPAPTTGAPDRP